MIDQRQDLLTLDHLTSRRRLRHAPRIPSTVNSLRSTNDLC
jgi:hypothetical protein